jgi:hypothetical protein
MHMHACMDGWMVCYYSQSGPPCHPLPWYDEPEDEPATTTAGTPPDGDDGRLNDLPLAKRASAVSALAPRPPRRGSARVRGRECHGLPICSRGHTRVTHTGVRQTERRTVEDGGCGAHLLGAHGRLARRVAKKKAPPLHRHSKCFQNNTLTPHSFSHSPARQPTSASNALAYAMPCSVSAAFAGRRRRE